MRLLRSFEAVADELHFGRAARRLYVSQPSLSRSIRELERRLGVELFARTSREVRLTEAGRILHERLPRPLGDLDALLTYIGRVGRGEVGHLGIAFLPSATNRLLPAIVRAFRSSFPSVSLALEETLDDAAIEGLLARRFDVALVRIVRSRPELRFEPLVREPLCVAVGHDHRLASRKRLRYADLRDERFILWPRQLAPESFDEIVERCRSAGFTPQVVQEAEHAPTILGLVAAGVGISVLARSYEALRSGDVLFVPLERDSTTLHVAWRADDRSAARQNFVEIARRVGPSATVS